MVKNYQKYFGLLLLLFVVSCQTVSVNTSKTRPSEVNMDRYNTVAILEIEHDRDSFLKNQIFEKVASNGRLKFIDQREINRVIEYNLGTISDAYSAEGASKIGQLVKADVVIFGVVKEEAWDDHQIVEVNDFNLFRDPDEEPVIYYGRKGFVRISASISVVDTATGQVITRKNYNESADTVYGKEENPDRLPRIDLKPLYERCCQRVSAQFAKVVTPYHENIKVNLEIVDHPDFDRGLAFAQNGSWNKAAEVFRGIQEHAIRNQGVMGVEAAASAYFNYGVALQYDGDYERALQYLDQAYTANPTKRYKNQIDACQREKQDSYRLGG